MMKRASHFKLGLFVLIVLITLAATATGLGARHVRKETVEYHTYFNESVQGLEVGSPVKFRGVLIGTVSAIEIAPDSRHVEVVAELDVKDIRRMGLTEAGLSSSGGVQFKVPSDLRAQLASQGITGVKYLLIDYFDEKQNPPPELPFEPAENYIPAAVSLLKSLEDSIVNALDNLPDVSNKILAVLTKVDSVLADLKQQALPEKMGNAVESASLALADFRKLLGSVDKERIPEKISGALANVDKAITRMNTVLASLDGEKGLVASAKRATDSFGDAGRTANSSAKQLQSTLRSIDEAAEAIRDLAEALERDPDMLLKGRKEKKR